MVRNLVLNANFNPILIGSLPFQSPDEALEVVFQYCPKSPSWPQLPKITSNESMSFQYLEGIPGWILDGESVLFLEPEEIKNLELVLNYLEIRNLNYFAISDKFSLTFDKFIKKLQDKKVELIKGQVIGPITFLTSHKKKSNHLLISDDFYKDIIPKALKLKADYQVHAFDSVNPMSSKIIFFDEPILSQIGSAVLNLKKEEVKKVYDDILGSDLNYYAGMHICGNSEWDFILSLPIKIINFDAYKYLEEFFLYEKDIKKFVDKGGYIAFGIIPTDSDDLIGVTEYEIKEKIFYIEEKIKELTGLDKISERIFYTPSCGMGALSAEETFKVLNLLSNIKKGQ